LNEAEWINQALTDDPIILSGQPGIFFGTYLAAC
jgi:hypothetical protein